MWEFGKGATLFCGNTPNVFQVVLGKNTHAGGEYSNFRLPKIGAFSANGKVYVSLFLAKLIHVNSCLL